MFFALPFGVARVKLSMLRPAHPERICWGCDQRCPADALACGNGSERTQHPIELFGDEWESWSESESGAENTVERLFGVEEADPSGSGTVAAR